MLILLKKTRLMRYSPLYTCRFDSFLNRYPIKPNLIYVKDSEPCTRQGVRACTRDDADFVRARINWDPVLYRPKQIRGRVVSKTNNNVISKKNVNDLLKCTKKQTSCNKNTNKKNKIETYKYYTTMGLTGIFLSTFFYSYNSYSYYENAITTLTMYK